jgi:hypothetical protein
MFIPSNFLKRLRRWAYMELEVGLGMLEALHSCGVPLPTMLQALRLEVGLLERWEY